MFTEATRTDAVELFDQGQLVARLGNGHRPGKKPRAGGQGSRAAGVKTFVLDTNVLLHDPACVQNASRTTRCASRWMC